MQGPQTGVEYDESLTAGQRGGWGEHTFVPGGLGGPGDILALRIVVAEEVVLIDPKVSTDLLVGQVEDIDSNRTRPTRRRTSKGSTPSSMKWRNSSAHAASSWSDAYQTPLAPRRW